MKVITRSEKEPRGAYLDRIVSLMDEYPTAEMRRNNEGWVFVIKKQPVAFASFAGPRE